MKIKLSTIHLALAQARKERGISQAQISNELAVEQAAISLYENGRRGIPLETLERWAELLDIDITITPKGYEPMNEPDYEQRDLEEWSRLKRRRNTLIAEMRSLMAIRTLQAPKFQAVDGESGESRFWVYSFHADHSIGLVESRHDHTSQKHLAVEYTGEEVNVYKFDPEFIAQSGGLDRTYLTEDDFLTLGSNASHEEMVLLKSTIFREKASKPDGVELVNPEGFSIRSLWEMQESHTRFSAMHDEVIGCAEYQEMEEELLQIEGLLDDLMIDNRLSNGMPNPAFVRWNDEDTEAVSVPLHEPERTWRWIEEGVSWVADCQGEVELRLWVNPEVHEEYESLRDENGARVIGSIGPDKKPAIFKVNPVKNDMLYRIEIDPSDLTEDEMSRYQKIIESTHQLDELRNKE